MHSCGEGEGTVPGVPVGNASWIRAYSLVVLVLPVVVHGEVGAEEEIGSPTIPPSPGQRDLGASFFSRDPAPVLAGWWKRTVSE